MPIGTRKSYQVVTWEQRFDLYPAADEIICSAWPRFMLHNQCVAENWSRFVETDKHLQLMLVAGEEILAVINTQAIRISHPLCRLPQRGWEWGFLTALEQKQQGIPPNYLLGFQVVVNPKHQGQGLAQAAVKEMKYLSQKLGLRGVLIALRPSKKEQFPLISMEEYLQMKGPLGEYFDPWLRIHQRLGAEVVSICAQAYSVQGSLADWREWTGQEFPCSGRYPIAGGLVPLEVSVEEDFGKYTEPNVWIVHRNE